MVTAVVPSPKRSTLGSSDSSVRPARSATSRQAARTPAPTSSGVVGALARHVVLPSVSTASVNVPPMSTPMHATVPPPGANSLMCSLPVAPLSPDAARPQLATIPPSTGRATPVTKDASSEHSHTAAAAISSGSPKRFIGLASRMKSLS